MTDTDTETKGLVLIVDDEAEIREILAVHIESCGYQILEAEDGQRALEIVRSNDVDVIVSDVMMPRMSGMMLLRSLREEGYDAPCVFVSAYPSKEATIEALRLGAFDFIEKPFESAHIIRLVSEAMRVSVEKKQIMASAVSQGEAGSIAVERQILALRSLRYQNQPEFDQKEKSAPDERLVEMFVSEALPQLVFCDASVKGLADIDARSWELGYLFRVMQGLKAAAGAVGLDQIEKFTGSLENCFTVFRVRPSAMNDVHIELLVSSIDVARELISTLGSEDSLSEDSAKTEASVYKLDARLNPTEDQIASQG